VECSNKAYDKVTEPSANVEVNFTTWTFIFDNTPPVSSVNVPANQWYGNNLTQFSGDVSDSKTGVKRVELWMEWSSTSPVAKYYDGNSWLTNEAWFDIGSTAWNYSVSTEVFKSCEKYKIKVRGVDNTDYSENVEDGDSKAGVEFYFDNIAPKTVVNYPASNSEHIITNKVTGTASDDPDGIYQYEAGMKVTEIALKDKVLNKWWDGGSSTNSFSSDVEVWIGTTNWSAPNWEVSIPTTIFISGHSYQVKSRGTDLVPEPGANVEVPSSINDFEIDFLAPQSAITYPVDGEYHNDSPLTITGTASDDYAGVEGVELTIQDLVNGQYWHGASGWLVV